MQRANHDGSIPVLLREQDLNLRPLGYEPNELPTAPPRNTKLKNIFQTIKRYFAFLKVCPVVRNP